MKLPALLPFLMSFGVLALMMIGSPLPIHDEDGTDHLGMVLMIGQIPLMAYFAVSGRRSWRRMAPVLALQSALWGGVALLIHRQEQAALELVLRRQQDNRPLAGSEGALREYLQRGNGLTPSANLGAVQSLTFAGVDRLGWDRYAVHYAGGDLEGRIFVTPDGKIRGITMIEAGTGCRSTEPYECRPS